jgi:hypothetical protein
VVNPPGRPSRRLHKSFVTGSGFPYHSDGPVRILECQEHRSKRVRFAIPDAVVRPWTDAAREKLQENEGARYRFRSSLRERRSLRLN